MNSTHSIQRGQRYRRLIVGGMLAGVVAFLFAGVVLDQVLAGLVVYAVAGVGGIVALLYFQFASSVRLVDERQVRLQERASNVVLRLFAYVGIPVWIAVFLLEATGHYEIGPTVAGSLYTFSAIYLVLLAVYVTMWLRS